MPTIVTRDQSVTELRHALLRWERDARAIWSFALARANAEATTIDAELRNRSNALAAAQQVLAHASREQVPAALHAVHIARQRHHAALQASRHARNAVAALTRDARLALASLDDVPRATRTLAAQLRALNDYRSTGGGGQSGAPSNEAASNTAGDSGTWAAVLTAHGLSDIDLSHVDFTDNPIVDNFTGYGLTAADYRWAVQTWDQVVRPALMAGGTRDDLVARDASRGASPLRRTSDIHDIFLKDPIAVSRLPDGTFDVTNGRHRIQVARNLGITHLPGRIL